MSFYYFQRLFTLYDCHCNLSSTTSGIAVAIAPYEQLNLHPTEPICCLKEIAIVPCEQHLKFHTLGHGKQHINEQ